MGGGGSVANSVPDVLRNQTLSVPLPGSSDDLKQLNNLLRV